MPLWLVELLANDAAQKVGIFLAGIFLSFWKLVLPAISAHVTRKFVKSDPGPTAPMPIPEPVLPLPAPEPAQPIVASARDAERAMVEWSMDEARRRVRELQDEISQVRRDKREVEYQLEDTMRDNTRMSTALNAANIEVDRLQGELTAAEQEKQAEKARAAQAWRALAEYKREVTSGFSGSANVTPLRPPRSR